MTWSAPSDRTRSSRARDAGHIRSERLRDLHREGPDATRGAVDQDLLPGFDLAVIPQRLQGDVTRHRDGRRLLEGEVGRLGCERIFGDGRILGEGTAELPGRTEDLVARPKPRHGPADGLHLSRHIRPSNPVLWLA